MKFILTTLFVAAISAPLGFCEEGKCKGDCKDKDKKETITLAEEGKCKGDCKDKKKEEGTVAEGKCNKKDGDKKEEGTFA